MSEVHLHPSYRGAGTRLEFVIEVRPPVLDDTVAAGLCAATEDAPPDGRSIESDELDRYPASSAYVPYKDDDSMMLCIVPNMGWSYEPHLNTPEAAGARILGRLTWLIASRPESGVDRTVVVHKLTRQIL